MESSLDKRDISPQTPKHLQQPSTQITKTPNESQNFFYDCTASEYGYIQNASNSKQICNKINNNNKSDQQYTIPPNIFHNMHKTSRHKQTNKTQN